MTLAIEGRFLGGMARLEFALAVAAPDADRISERFPRPVSFGVGHGISVAATGLGFSEGLPPQNRPVLASLERRAETRMVTKPEERKRL